MPSFLEEVNAKIDGVPLQRCFHCRKCTAGCPTASAMDVKPNALVKLVQRGERAKALGSSAIWLCASCETCTTRCPCEIDVAKVMDTLGIIARREGKVSEKNIQLFYDSFLDSMKQHGRLFEMGTLLAYNIKSGRMFTDADLGPKVMAKGKIHFLPKNIKGRDKVEKIFARFREKAKKHG